MSNFSEQTGRPILGSLEEIYGYITKRHDTIMFELQESIELQTKMIPIVEKAKLSGVSNVYIKSIPPFVCNELTESFVSLMSGNVTMCFIANTLFDTFDDDFVSKIFSVFKTRDSLRDLFVSVSLMNNKSARVYLSGRNKLKHINFSLDFSEEVGAFRFCVEEIKNTPLSISCTFREKTEWDKLAATLKFIKKPVPISVLTFHYVFHDVGGILPVFRKLSNWSIDTVWLRSCVVPLPIEILKNARRVEIGLGEVDWGLFTTEDAINVFGGEEFEGSLEDFMVSRCKKSALIMLRKLKASNHQKLKMVICTLDGPDIAKELQHFQEPRLVIQTESEPVKRPRRPRVFLPKDKEAVIAECFSEPLVDTIPTTSVEESEEDTICSDQLCTKSVIKSTDYFYELVCSSPDKHTVRYHKACKRLDVPCHCASVWQVCYYVQEKDGERTVKHTEVLVDDNSVLESILVSPEAERSSSSEPEPEPSPEPEPEIVPELVAKQAPMPKIAAQKPKFVFEKSKQARQAEVANEFKIKRGSKAGRSKKQVSSSVKPASSPAEQVCDALLKRGFFSPLEECQAALDRSLSSVSLAIDLLLSWHRQQVAWSEE